MMTHILTGNNRAELLTKLIYLRKWGYHVIILLYDIYDDHILERNCGISHFEGKL